MIIHLPDSVSIAALSATVSNAEEFGEWLETVRGETVTIVEETRPVPLYQHVVVGRRLLDLFADDDAHESPDQQKVNPELQRVARDDWASRQMRDRRTPRSGRGQTNRGRAIGVAMLGMAAGSGCPVGSRSWSCWIAKVSCQRSSSSSVELDARLRSSSV
ncbi:MAG: hypothetical protein R2709_03335 [Marmoricola sp.]